MSKELEICFLLFILILFSIYSFTEDGEGAATIGDESKVIKSIEKQAIPDKVFGSLKRKQADNDDDDE